jgi:hypothetical protein
MPLELPIETLPMLIEQTADALIHDGFELDCPAAKKNGANTIVLCGIERQPIPVRSSPLSIAMWCAGDHTDCPTWQAARDRDPALERAAAAQAEHEHLATTEREIRSGLRIDDQGIEQRDLELDAIRERKDASTADGEVKRSQSAAEAAEFNRELAKDKKARG